MTNLPPNFPPPPPGGPIYGQHLPPGWENRNESDFWDAFDFSFESYATPAVVKVVYMLTVILCFLTYVGNVLVAFAIFLPDLDFAGFKVPGSAFPGIVALVLGWIPAFIVILVMRVALEGGLANVRTAIDARALRMRYVGGVAV
jgi:hypothetical protein